MKKYLSGLFIFSFLLLAPRLLAQSCFNVNAGKDTLVGCTQVFIDLKARIPNLKTTDDYIPVSINYAPYPFTSPAGTELDLLYDDDIFSDSLTLPFDFCFYGQTYHKISVGSNGVFTFDVTKNATKEESYVLKRDRAVEFDSLPFAGGTFDNRGIFYAPRASIF